MGSIPTPDTAGLVIESYALHTFSMTGNDFILILTAVFCTACVFLAWRTRKALLYTAIIIFLILIGTVGGKLVLFFGHVTNSGNIFYASVYLATYFLIERFGKREGIRSIWIGIAGAVTFAAAVQLVLALSGETTTEPVNAALVTIFGSSFRVGFASIVAYGISQHLNVYLYSALKERMNGSRLWLRANLSNAFAQALDSVVFFTIAFWGVVPPGNIGDIIITGFVIKVLFIMITSPLLYLNRFEEEDGKGYSTIRIG